MVTVVLTRIALGCAVPVVLGVLESQGVSTRGGKPNESIRDMVPSTAFATPRGLARSLVNDYEYIMQ